MTNVPAYDIFVGYSHRDVESAARIAKAIREFGLTVWFDRWEVRPGEPIMLAIEKGIQQSHTMLLLIGPGARHDASRGIAYEGAYAFFDPTMGRGFRLIPVLLPGASPEDIPAYLRNIVYLDLRELTDPTLREAILKLPLVARPLSPSVSAPKVFLCHAKEDSPRIEELYFTLKDEGLNPWYDKKHLFVGDRWEEEILRAISQSDFFSVFLSGSSVRKTGFIQREIKTAVNEYQKRPQGIAYFLPVRLEECVVPKIRLDTNTTLVDFQWIDLFEGDENAVGSFAAGIWEQWRRAGLGTKEAPTMQSS